MVLVHGGWVWRPVAALLRDAGHEVHAPTLTGTGERAHLHGPQIGLATHVEEVVACWSPRTCSTSCSAGTTRAASSSPGSPSGRQSVSRAWSTSTPSSRRPGQSRFAGFAASAREDGSWRGGEVVDIGHDAMVTDPEGTARVLLALVSAARAGPARRRSP